MMKMLYSLQVKRTILLSALIVSVLAIASFGRLQLIAAIGMIEKSPLWQSHWMPVLLTAFSVVILVTLQQVRIHHTNKISRRLEKAALKDAEQIAFQQNTIQT